MIDKIISLLLLSSILYDIYLNLSLKNLMQDKEPLFKRHIENIKEVNSLNNETLDHMRKTKGDFLAVAEETGDLIERLYTVLEQNGLIKISERKG